MHLVTTHKNEIFKNLKAELGTKIWSLGHPIGPAGPIKAKKLK